MGKLIDPERTKKAREARDARAKKILEAARSTFVRFPYSEVTLDTIGQQAGVKQGQANLAFRSREELYLSVLLAELGAWYDTVETRLEADDAPAGRAGFAEMVASSLAERPELTKLLGPLHTALELHEDGIEVHRFYQWQRQRLLEIGERAARRINGVSPWQVFDALYRSQIVAAAVHQVSRPVGNLAVDLAAEDLQVFALDLEGEVQRAILSTLQV